MAVSAAESPRLFSFRVPVSPGLAQPQRALRLLAAHQVDRTHLALSLFRPELRPDPRNLEPLARMLRAQQMTVPAG